MMPTVVTLMAALLLAPGALTTLQDLECPDVCDCHYFRINWVTDCSESNLTAVPTDGLSMGVYILNMDHNNVADLQAFPPDIKLRTLRMRDNRLTRLTRDATANLQFLLEAHFSNNQIAVVDPDVFQDSPGLIELELAGNPLQLPIDGPLLACRSLLYLDISRCGISSLPTDVFANSTTLKRLDLSDNPLAFLPAGALAPLTVLEELRLNNCNITHIADMALSNLSELRILELSGNMFQIVNWHLVLGNLVHLDHLDLRKSNIHSLPADAFDNLTWLRSLVLAENELTDLDVATTLGDNLRHLDSLDLSNCRLRGPLSEYAFANATRLRTLLLTGNPLRPADIARALTPLTRLQKLSLRSCGLSRLPENTFEKFTSTLEDLDMSHNPLNNAFTGLLTPLRSLEILNIGYSNLSRVHRDTFSKMTELKHLIMSGNHLTFLELGLFQHLAGLVSLELNNCGLTEAPGAEVFAEEGTYADLQELKLAGNPLVVSDRPLFPSQLSRLRIVDLSRCNLTSLPASAFDTTTNIVDLNLSGNLLRSEPETNPFEFLRSLRLLEKLDVSNCKLSQISPRFFENNVNITWLKLSGNRWKCDCSIAEMWRWSLNKKRDGGVLVGADERRGLLCVTDDVAESVAWQRFVRESGCAPSANLRARRYSMLPSYASDSANSPPTWLVATTCLSIVVFLATVTASGFALLLGKVRRAKERNAALLEPELALSPEEQEREVHQLRELYRQRRALWESSGTLKLQ